MPALHWWLLVKSGVVRAVGAVYRCCGFSRWSPAHSFTLFADSRTDCLLTSCIRSHQVRRPQRFICKPNEPVQITTANKGNDVAITTHRSNSVLYNRDRSNLVENWGLQTLISVGVEFIVTAVDNTCSKFRNVLCLFSLNIVL